MKTILTGFSLLFVTAAAFGQARLDSRAAMLVSATVQQSAPAARSGEVRAVVPEYGADENISVFVAFADGYDASVLDRLGIDHGPVRAGITLATLTPMQLVSLVDEPGIDALEMGAENRPMLMEARKVTGVDAIQAGTGLDKAYTGAGVVCGMMDIGFDPNHINFLDADGKQRIKRMWVITGSNGSIQSLNGSQITSYTTDNSAEAHGTHVLGIMAGGYRDRLEQAYYNASGKIQRGSTRKNYYYGVATDADLAPCCGTLSGDNVIRAAEQILAYAKELGKPAVMNLSLGHNTGPHDGSTKADKYLAEVGKEMLITISAGNEGDEPVSLRKTFTASDNTVRTFAGQKPNAYGVVDVWGFDDKPFTVEVAGVNKTSGEVLFSYTVDNTSGEVQYVTGSYYTIESYVKPEKFDQCFGNRGAILVKSGVDASNNRFSVNVSVNTQKGTLADVVPAIIVKGSAGQTVDIYGSADCMLYSNGLAGYTEGNPQNSINDMACGDNVLAVGAYVSAKSWPTLTSEFTYRNSVVGDIADFSSYGLTPDGRHLPHITAPGSAIISSISTYNYDADPNSHDVSARKTDIAHPSYWEEMSGTSMAAPFAGGVLALWLQADPTLTMDRVKEILKETAVNDEFTKANPARFGMGKIDALAGLKKVLGTGAGVSDVVVDSEILVSETGVNSFNIYAPAATSVSAVLYSLSGAQAAAVEASGSDVTLDASSLTPGVYVLRIAAGNAGRTTKVVVR